MKRIVDIASKADQERDKATKELTDLIKQAESEKQEFDQQINLVNAKIEKEK